MERALGTALSQFEELIDLLREAEGCYGAAESASLRREIAYREQQVEEMKEVLDAHPGRLLRSEP